MSSTKGPLHHLVNDKTAACIEEPTKPNYIDPIYLIPCILYSQV